MHTCSRAKLIRLIRQECSERPAGYRPHRSDSTDLASRASFVASTTAAILSAGGSPRSAIPAADSPAAANQAAAEVVPVLPLSAGRCHD
jgi:hypothetical protein